MPIDLGKDDSPTNFPTPNYLTINNFKKGVISLVDKSMLPRNAMETADNIFLYEDGQAGPRPGVNWFGGYIPRRTASVTVTTNLVKNPSAEVDTSNWTADASLSLTRDGTKSTSDSYSFKLTNISGFETGYAMMNTATGLNGIPVTAGTSYTLQCQVMKDTATTSNGDMGINWYNSSGTFISTSWSGDFSLTPLVWSHETMTATAPVGAAYAAVVLERNDDGIHSERNVIYWFDSVMFEQASSASDYFDGATPDTESTDYAWTGTVHGSTSTKSVYVLEDKTIEGFDYFDFDGVIHLVLKTGTQIYRSTNDGTTWEECTGATFTSGVWTNFNQNGAYLYITNGTDAIARYDGTTTLQVYTTLTTPAAPTVAETGTGLTSGTNYNYYYKCARVNQVGFSAASAASTVIQTGLARESWTPGTNYATLTLPALSGTQTRYDVYVSTDNVYYYYLGSTATTTFVDDGTQLIVPGTSAPTDNTTTGPLVKELVNVGSRQYGVRDSNNRYRIWFTGTGEQSGSFSTAYDGGYIDWQEGGKYIPMKVEDYRDGKGTPYATVWCNSADGQGCILQVSLDTLTIGDVSITVPSAYKLPGSRGTPAPGSVVNVLNDYYFYNSQAFYNLGSRAQFLNLLSTDEASANIRPTIKQISPDGESGIASIYSDAKVYFSVPYGSSTNNYTAIYDTEQKAWLPTAFTMGFSKFLRYTDTTNARRLLCLKPGDVRLSEISSSIQGDYGEPFQTTLLTGLYPVSKNRFEFQFTEEAEIEFSNPQGAIDIELIGIERSRGFRTTNTETITTTLSTTGHSTYAHSTRAHTDTSDAPSTYSESSIKRYFPVQRELNAIQWKISTNTLSSRYVTRTLQTWGTETMAGKPRQWRI